MPERLVVIGGDAAGMSAATNARRMRPAHDLEIVVFERGEWVSFSACGEPYYVSGEVQPFEELLIRSPEEFGRAGIAVHRWHEVTEIDLDARTVTVQDHRAQRHRTEGYDFLMYATGASAHLPALPGVDLPGVHSMHRLDDALAVRRLVEEERPRSAVVVGGGWVGIEMADAFHGLGIETTVITRRGGMLAPSLDPEMSALLTGRMQALGVHVLADRHGVAIRGDSGGVSGVVTTANQADEASPSVVPADLVLLALGTLPNVDLARRAGLRIGESGGVWVDAWMRTNAPAVYAGGDCAEALHRISGKPVNFHLGTIANKQGRIAGLNIGGADERFPGVLGTAITKFADIEVARTGLTLAQARESGFDAIAVAFDTKTTAGYWPAAAPMTVQVVVDPGTRRLLGAQIVGGPTAGKRIDGLAMALWTEMTVDTLVNVDLSYAPPFSAVWDPVLLAARRALSTLVGGR